MPADDHAMPSFRLPPSARVATRRTARQLMATRLLAAALSASCVTAVAAPVTFKGTVFTNVHLNGKEYDLVDLTITFSGDTSNIGPVTCNAVAVKPGIIWLPQGTAKFSFERAGHTVSGTFAPGQLYVSADGVNGGVGFGSYLGSNCFGEPGYPLAFENGSVNAWAYNWPTATSTDGPDLTQTVDLSGNAWSCVGYPPDVSGTKVCEPALALKTSKGDLLIDQPYYKYFFDAQGVQHVDGYTGSLNRGTFSIIPGSSRE